MTERTEYIRFKPDACHVIEGDDLNTAWKVSCILCAGDSRLSPDQRRDLGQQLQAALQRAEAIK